MSSRGSRTLLWSSGVVVFLALGSAIGPDRLQGQVTVAATGAWATDTRAGLGVRTGVDLDGWLGGFEVFGAFDYYFPGDAWGADTGAWEGGIGLARRFAAPGRSLTPYAGLGVGASRFRVSTVFLGSEISADETTWGVNFLAGAIAGTGRVRPFGEVRYVASDRSRWVVSAGVKVSVTQAGAGA